LATFWFELEPPCCWLEGEMKMNFEMLVTMDGNDSLKRILVKDKKVDKNGASYTQLREGTR
jgi:hypothetical protein